MKDFSMLSEDVRKDILRSMKIGPTKAAKMAGVARSTIYKDMEDGKISFEKSAKGRKVIDISELERAYGPFNGPDIAKTSESVRKRQYRTDEKDSSDSTLSVEVKMLREQIARIDTMNDREREKLEEQIEDLREDRDKWRIVAEKQMDAVKLITDQSEQPTEKKKGFFGSLFGA